jgi:hypothetical protein
VVLLVSLEVQLALLLQSTLPPLLAWPTKAAQLLACEPSFLPRRCIVRTRARPPSLAVISQPFYHYIIGLAVGQTNVYFFGADGRQVEGRNIAVLLTS